MKILNEPSTRDLGKFENAVAICGGVYGNLEALEAFFSCTDRLGIPSNRIIHTGDIVAYCADPSLSTELVMKRGIHNIKGNVEDNLAKQAENCGCGFEKGSACDRLSHQWFNYTDDQITKEQRLWMSDLPDHLTFSLSNHSFRVVHGSIYRNNEFVYNSSQDKHYSSQFADIKEDVVIAGHSGLPFTRAHKERLWHNSGALGMPANDGTPRTWCSIILPEGNNVKFRHIAINYDHQTTYRKMLNAGLPWGYADAVMSGLWPSLDSMPADEQQQTGIPLDFTEIVVQSSAIEMTKSETESPVVL